MRAALQSLQKTPCRTHEITTEDRTAFPTIRHLQRYYPALDLFPCPLTERKHLEFATRYQVTAWLEESAPKFWKAMRKDTATGLDDPTDAIFEPCDVFVKTVHLLNPVDMLREKYVCPEHPLLPQSESTWKHTLQKLHTHNNQAYVDAVANAVLSRFRELDLTPHCILSYGAFTGIRDTYRFNITGEYDSYRQCRWFWDGMASHSARLTVRHGELDEADAEWFAEVYQDITSRPAVLEGDAGDLDTCEVLTIPSDGSVSAVHAPVAELIDFTFDTIEEAAENTTDIMELHRKVLSSRHGTPVSVGSVSTASTRSNSHSSQSDGSDGSDGSDELEPDIEIELEVPHMPVIVIAQEAQEGVMDALLDEEELDGHKRGSEGWEAHWLAWLFQVVAGLTFLQSAICFTHNDLHSNNILWRRTDKKWLYYTSKDGTVWRVPTYGKIFTIIDFGRSIFRLGRRLWVSDDHWPDQDAGDQYNFGPFFDHRKPKVPPNPSFDLCRLAVSLLDGLYDEPPPKKKGKGFKAAVMSEEEDGFKVYETRSPLYNLLWSWTVDDQQRTVYETSDGEEKYEGFELYIRIAQDVHHVVPKDQLRRDPFTFEWKEAVPAGEKVYALGV